MITFKSQTLLLVFLSVLYTLLLNYPKGNDETFTIYIVFHLCSKKKMPFSIVSILHVSLKVTLGHE